ncbi:UNVERIFIED_CONTAM: hypothetical protein Cloal_0442 [Acetivibrio alkalicellulosi]
MEETLKLILDKLNSMDKSINVIQKDVGSFKEDVKGLKRDVIRIENEHDGAKLDSLMDGYKMLYEGQEEIKKTLDNHEVKLLKIK